MGAALRVAEQERAVEPAVEGDQASIPCVFMRGGSSRGAFFHGKDLPEDPAARDRVVLAAYGSPDPRQIDGIGGADPLTSKVAVVDPATRSDADVVYTFGQVSIATPEVFWVGNCGNMLSGVAVFAVDEGLVEATEPVSTVRIYAANVDQVVEAEVPVVGGVAQTAGGAEVAGVPGTGAAIMLDFGDCAGAVTGRLLPTGSAREKVDVAGLGSVEVSVVDASTPFVYVRARDLGVDPTIGPDEILADHELLERLELVRSEAAVRCGLVDHASRVTEVSPSIPRVTMVGESDSDGEGPDVECRQMSMQRPHRTYAVTNGVCTAVAAQIPGTLVNEAATVRSGGLRIGHPAGIVLADATVVRDEGTPDGYRVTRAAIARTARRIMRGDLYVPKATLDKP